MNRRQFFRRALTAVGAGFVGLTGWGYAVEPRVIRTERVTIAIADLPPSLEGFRIGFLTDLHIGPFTTGGQIHKAAAMLMAEKPDLVLLGGDYTSDESGEGQLDEALSPLPAAYGVLGNWDYFKWFRLRRLMPKQVRILTNEGLLVRPDLWLGGVEDLQWGDPDVEKALQGAPPGALRILLSHEPDFVTRVKPEHRIALQISGHSHGGQVRIPVVGPLLLPPGGRKYHTGLYQTESTQVYTSRGLGMSQLPIRFACPPEISVLTLTAHRTT